MTLSNPQAVQERLESIEADLAVLQNELEDAALAWFTAKREKDMHRAQAFLSAQGDGKTIAERNALADGLVSTDGMIEEATWEGKKAVLKTLETRAAIGMSILRSQGRS